MGEEPSLDSDQKMRPATCFVVALLTMADTRVEGQLPYVDVTVQDVEDNFDSKEDFLTRARFNCDINDRLLFQRRNSSLLKIDWKEYESHCIQEAAECWTKIQASNRNASYCPPLWDDQQCWPEQEIGTLVYGHCPDTVYPDDERSSCPRFSTRYCDPQNIYISKPDYDTCETLEFHRVWSKDDPQEPNELERRCCRTERRVALSWQAYILDTCARCYMYLPSGLLSKDRFIYEKGTATLRDPTNNHTYWAIWTNSSHPIFRTFLSVSASFKWRSCCQEALLCCHLHQYSNITLGPKEFLASTPSCPATWDGWQCYPSTPAGSISRVPCADHIYFKTEKPSCPKHAEKACKPDGRWYFDKKRRKEWTSYKPCGRLDDLRRQLLFHVSMYSISVIVLIPALSLFFSYKQLQVYRISMHKHFFSSLLLNGLCSIIFKCIVMLDELKENSGTGSTLLDFNSSWCKSLLLLTKYFRLTNYMWMFCEGFYLHRLIAAAFAEQKNLITYYAIGWGFPIIPVAVYGAIRKLYSDEQCWVIPVEDVEWVINGPSLLSLVINLIFLCSIIRVLVTKLRATHASEPSHYRKAVRATVVLVPLFGLHFLLILYRPQAGTCQFLTAYVYFSHTLDGLQGFFVSLTFCYCNGEIQSLIWRSVDRYHLRRSLTTRSVCQRSIHDGQIRLKDFNCPSS